ncbi:uncharacterized protein BO80DRAFT_378774 [Aspergillus ibericus CBS 121593]|uniref:PPM-type phosphatase domain-containing protein n=1 Tax=Aspergillus ibericus CBS 121593 TaxID=1448316 RepID=A0A395H3B3_9EURO|nr:hypothetical protein BO80DRAFT_378774 [Aspergillus ibericus CBS 121593]RAL02387.1 hypothetical protein BO80DRAFT_378774 [Aspergillus ibericus CBS 121593]
MTPSHRSASQLWAIARRKLFSRRGSYDKDYDSQHRSSDSADTSSLSEQNDGFYKYSQEVVDKSDTVYRKVVENMGIRSSDSTGASYASASMVPIGRPPLPYTVGDPEWDTTNGSVKYLDHACDDDISAYRTSVLSVYTRVYTVAKVVFMSFLHYGLDLDDIPDGLMAYIRNAEQAVTSNKITDMVNSVNNLYHALYARLIMEIANVDLCSCFNFGVARVSSYNNFILPEPRHLFNIFLACKGILDSPTVCSVFNREVVGEYQSAFIRRSVQNLVGTGIVLDDLIGFRRFVLRIVEDRESPFRKKWGGSGLVYHMPPAELLAVQAERYMAFTPRETHRLMIPDQVLPFVERYTIDPERLERGFIQDHRQAALAMLEGKTLGDLRNENPADQLMKYVKERKCICQSACSCSMICTREPERPCPCSEWKMTVMLAQRRSGRGPLGLRDRCTVLSKAVFLEIASIRDDVDTPYVRWGAGDSDGQPVGGVEEVAVVRSRARFSGLPKIQSECLTLQAWDRHSISGKLLAGMVPKIVASPTGLILSTLAPSLSPCCQPVRLSPPGIRRSPLWSAHSGAPRTWVRRYRAVWPSYGITTPVPDPNPQFPISRSPFCFQTGYALCAKRPSRPFPPPFLSPPSSSFSDPLTTHYLSQDKRLSVRGDLVRGLNNGDDAVLVAENYLAVNDGVGAWATRPRGHAALWSRLLLHFWALEVERDPNGHSELDPIGYLQRAFKETTRATTSPGEWFGTTTSVTALLHWKRDETGNIRPLLYVTNLGDCKVFVIRPSEKEILFRTQEQWHWFDCPMQLGTNSVDTPEKDAVLSLVDVQEGDLVVAVSDGILDNLWEHEILTVILESLEKWDQGRHENKELDWAPPAVLADEQMVFVARELLNSALAIAQDPFAESPYMEKAVDEGLAMQGGKMDDISVVIGFARYLPSATSHTLNSPRHISTPPSHDRTVKMRAKRSKKYRKLMHQYELTFGFREPYQVLVDSNFLRAVYNFKMELIPALERTLQGKPKPLLTKCSLAAIMAAQPINPRTNNPYRPEHLPPPTVLPLRHCSHNADSTPIDEVACLLSLLSPSAETKKNKEHYILATADPHPTEKKDKAAESTAAGRKRKRDVEDKAEAALRKARDLRRQARSIPGVPIVYVKRSVMVLEPMSDPSDAIREGVEQGKFRVGLTDQATKRERAAAAAAGAAGAAGGTAEGEKKKKKDSKKPKGPNPLSMKKPKKRVQETGAKTEKPKREREENEEKPAEKEVEGDGDGEAAPKAKRRRRHHRGAKADGDGEGAEAPAEAPADTMDD